MFSFKKVCISFCSNALMVTTSSQGDTAIKPSANWLSFARNKRSRSSAPCTESITQVLKMHLTCCAVALNSTSP